MREVSPMRGLLPQAERSEIGPGKLMRRDQLEHAIRTACQIIGHDAVVIVGSQAILGSFTEAGWCLDKEDLCVAKLCALREKDRNFVAALLDAGLVRTHRPSSPTHAGGRRCVRSAPGRQRPGAGAVSSGIVGSASISATAWVNWDW